MTCQSALDEQKNKLLETDPELLELLTDEYLLEYQKQRMKEMLDKVEKLRFGSVIDLRNTEEFLNAIDNEDKSVTVIIHIYEKSIPGCDAMNGCLINLAEEYPFVKFCKILGKLCNRFNVFLVHSFKINNNKTTEFYRILHSSFAIASTFMRELLNAIVFNWLLFVSISLNSLYFSYISLNSLESFQWHLEEFMRIEENFKAFKKIPRNFHEFRLILFNAPASALIPSNSLQFLSIFNWLLFVFNFIELVIFLLYLFKFPGIISMAFRGIHEN